MRADPIFQLSIQRAILDSADVEAQLSVRSGTRPVLTVLAIARAQAADALSSLADADAEDPKEIRRLQNEVKRFADLIEWFKHIVEEGHMADQVISDHDREELIDMLTRDLEGQEQAVADGMLLDGANKDA